MIRKFRLAGVSILFVLATLAACGGGGGGGALSPNSDSPTLPGTAMTATPTATAVGTLTGSATSATVGAAGGSVNAPDGRLALTIPAGALASDTVISIQPFTNLAHGKIGAAYRLTPEGQTFLKPVTLTFRYTDQDLPGTAAQALGAAYQTATGHWQWAGNATIDTTAKTVSIAATHFSVWSMVKGIQLQPASKTVKVKGSVALQVVVCYAPTVGPNDPTPLGYKCDLDGETAPLQPAQEWSVNGRPGGGAFGTVSGNGASATYTAPEFEPTPNVVAVSARFDWGGKGTMLAVSNITVVGDDSWTGTASFKDSINSASAQITWIFLSRDKNIAMYKATGTGTISSNNGTCSFPATSGTLDSAGILFVDFNTTPATYHGAAIAGAWTVTKTCKTSTGTETVVILAALPVFGGTKGPEGVEAAGTVLVSPASPPLPDDMTIEGSDTDGVDGTFHWKFTRNP